MAEATLLKSNLPGFSGNASLYRVNPPLAQRPWGEDDSEQKFEFVVVSAVVAMYSGPETYIFGADEQGEVIDWLELPGSFKGDCCHQTALENAGYEIAPQ